MGSGIIRNGHHAKISPNKTWNKNRIVGVFNRFVAQTDCRQHFPPKFSDVSSMHLWSKEKMELHRIDDSSPISRVGKLIHILNKWMFNSIYKPMEDVAN